MAPGSIPVSRIPIVIPRPSYLGLDFKNDDAVVSARGRRSFVGNLLNFTTGGTVVVESDIMMGFGSMSTDVLLLDNELCIIVQAVLLVLEEN